MRREVGGSWTVFDVFTGLPAIHPERMLASGLFAEEAGDVLDLLNFADCIRLGVLKAKIDGEALVRQSPRSRAASRRLSRPTANLP
ncbi:hypothetical protein CN189_23225 [Sinorhizobium meliloti]|nr:hypothetical protein CN189_23225 [Sinorhizobium meliloti]